MNKIILSIFLLLMPVASLMAQQKDISDMTLPELTKALTAELRTLKAVEAKGEKPPIAHSLGNTGSFYLAIAKKIDDMEEETEQMTKDKKTSLDKAIEYSNKSIAVSEEIGDMDQMKAAYKNVSAAQKMQGNVKGAMQTYAKMMSLKKTIFNSKKANDIEKKQIEYIHDRREDSLRKIQQKQQQIAEERMKEQARALALQQAKLDSANKTISTKEQEKTNVSLALQKTQTDLSLEKQNALEKEKQLTLAEEEKALQATNIQLQESKLALQQSELQLQENKMQLQQDELRLKDKVLGYQRTYIYIALAGLLLLAGFTFFIVRERKKAIQQKLRAERSEKFKQEFIANISHEIRTPMNAINGMTGLLLQKNPRPEQESYLKAINKSADILLHVINDVLDLSKIEAGKLELEAIDFSLSDMIQQVKDTLSYKAEDKGLQLITRIDDNVADVLVGDPYRLNQVLINLGGNALKFTEKGGVHIEMDLVKKEADNVHVKFSISDTGVGIPADKVSKLFDSFSQVNSSDTRKHGGTGLGLSISKYLVELHGGNIAVESTVGSGTTFSFIIKYPMGSAKRLHDRVAAEENADGTVLNGLRILIADDNEYNRLVVNETLHLMADLHTDLVVNGQESVDMMAKHNYDLILMDVQMPVMNGIDATMYIRKELPAPKNKVPIVALTASVLRADLDLCFQSGMTAYVPKPFKPWQLINTIAEVTGRDRKVKYAGTNPEKKKEEKEQKAKEQAEALKTNVAQEPSSTAQNLSSFEQTDNVTNLDYLRKFCEGDEKRMKKYIKVYLNALPGFYKNIDAAIENKDFVEIALHVHSFKPKWMMMGMKKTNELGIKIDQLCKSQNDQAFVQIKILMEDIDKSLKELEGMS